MSPTPSPSTLTVAESDAPEYTNVEEQRSTQNDLEVAPHPTSDLQIPTYSIPTQHPLCNPDDYACTSGMPSLPSISPLLEVADYMTPRSRSYSPYYAANQRQSLPALRRYTVQTGTTPSQIEDLSATLQVPENKAINSTKLQSVYVPSR